MVRVQMVSPLPPPYGGISHWTSMISRHACRVDGVYVYVTDTAPRRRGTYKPTLGRRLVEGPRQLVHDVSRLLLDQARQRPDVVHLNTSGHLAVFRDVVVVSLSRLLRIPVIYHLRFGRVPDLAVKNRWEWWMLSLSCRLACAVVAIDSGTETTIRTSIRDSNIVRIPNCIDLELVRYQREDQAVRRPFVLFVGWILPTKGIEDLLIAWESVRPAGWDLKIVGSGNGPYVDQLVLRCDSDASIQFLGERPHELTIGMISACELFVLPSHTEGFPNVVLEAMAMGRAIIASEVGAIPEMLDNGSGVLVRPGDPVELSQELGQLLNDSQRRSDLGARARFRVSDRYSIGVVFDQYVSLWEKVAGGRP